MQILARVLFGVLLSAATIAHAEEAKDAAKEAKTSMTLTTNAFLDKGMFPTLYTCDGKDISPQLTWADIPAKTKTVAVIMQDPNAPSGKFYHWVVYNVPAKDTTIAEGGHAPKGALLGKNSFDKVRYNGPCPPKGTAHNYTITAYALDTRLKLPEGAAGGDVAKAMQGHILAEATLSTVYSRWIK